MPHQIYRAPVGACFALPGHLIRSGIPLPRFSLILACWVMDWIKDGRFKTEGNALQLVLHALDDGKFPNSIHFT